MLAPFVLAAAAASLFCTTSAQCVESNGNWYCNQVDSISYLNFGKAGSYNRVSYMNPTGAVCNFSPQAYSGPLSPFDEEVSLHFRGPLQLKQFAYYIPAPSTTKRSVDHPRRPGHAAALDLREAELTKRTLHAEQLKRDEVALRHDLERRAAAPTCPGSNSTTYLLGSQSYMIECGLDRPGNIKMVYTATFAACISACSTTSACVDVSYVSGGGGACYMKSSALAPGYNANVWGARLLSASSASSSAIGTKSSAISTTLTSVTVGAPVQTSSVSSIKTTVSTTTTTTTTALTSNSPTATAATSGTYVQQAYYNAASGTSSGLVFLNNMGGSKSGTWDTSFGSSLSYAASSGTDSATSPQTLGNVQLPSSSEIILFSNASCASDGLCGYSRPGSVAYHGFGGASKVFLLEFSMPHDAAAGAADMPAVWMLNALIPRTQQYGACSCWGNTAGCGELDLFEVLTTGETRCVSSIHGNQAGGDSDYFARPTSGTLKAAVVMSGEQAHIKILNSAFTFDSVLSAATFANLYSTSSNYVVGNSSTVTLA